MRHGENVSGAVVIQQTQAKGREIIDNNCLQVIDTVFVKIFKNDKEDGITKNT